MNQSGQHSSEVAVTFVRLRNLLGNIPTSRASGAPELER